MYEKHCVSVPKDVQYICLLHGNLSNEEACQIEIDLIKEYGRKDLGTGILHNRTDGGDSGTPGRVPTAEQRTKSSLANRGQKRSEKTKRRIREALSKYDFTGENNHFYGKKHTKETRAKMSAAKKGKTYEEIFSNAEERRKSVSEKLKGRVFSEESLKKLRVPKGPQKRVTCPHCGMKGGISNMKRWHFDNCRSI